MPDDYMVRYRDKRIKTEFGHGRYGPARDAGPYGMIGGDGINDESNKTCQPYCGRQLAETQKGHSPDSAAEGFLGYMKTESVHPEHWEERTRDEVLALIDDYIHWYNHARIKRSFGWMSPVECRQKTKEGLRDCLQENVRSTFFPCRMWRRVRRPGDRRTARRVRRRTPPLVQGQFLWQRGGRVHVCFGKLLPRHPSARTSIASLSSIMGCAKRRLFRYISGRFMRESA